MTTLLQLLAGSVLTVSLFLPLYNAQYFGYSQQQSGQLPTSFSQSQQNVQGFGRYQQQTRPQRQTNNRRPGQQNNVQVPWIEVGGGQQGGNQQGSVPWVEAGNNGNQGGTQVQTGNNQGNNQQGNVPWVEVGQGTNGQQPATSGGGSRPSVGSGSGCSCSSTSEYNPVCGSDNATYSNPGRLNCAIQCQRRSNQMTNQTLITLQHYGVCRTNPTDPGRG